MHLAGIPPWFGAYTTVGILMLGGLLASALRNGPAYIGLISARLGIASVVIHDDDDLFEWCTHWLDRQPSLRRVRDLRASLAASSRNYWNGDAEPTDEILLTPGDGHHLFWFRNRPFWLARSRRSAASGDASRRRAAESIALRTIARDRRPIEELLADMRATYIAKRGDRLRVYVNDDECWELASLRDARPLATIVLPEGVADSLVADVERFRESAPWYRDLGIPHRRGYLFHGPPGTGKSSLVGALAGHFRSPIYALHLAARNLTDDRLLSLFRTIPPNSFVLLEDVDAAFAERRKTDDSRITLSGLLNAIDGVAAKDGLALVLTTNHLESLDPALVRAGRIDVRVAFANASNEQIETMFRRFFPYSSSAADFAGCVMPGTVPISSLQEFLLERRYDEAKALSDIAAWAGSAMRVRRRPIERREQRQGPAQAGPCDVFESSSDAFDLRSSESSRM